MSNIQEPLGGSQDMQDREHGLRQSGSGGQDETDSGNTGDGHSLPGGTQNASKNGNGSSASGADLELLQSLFQRAFNSMSKVMAIKNTVQQPQQVSDNTGPQGYDLINHQLQQMVAMAKDYHCVSKDMHIMAQQTFAGVLEIQHHRISHMRTHVDRVAEDEDFFAQQVSTLMQASKVMLETHRHLAISKAAAQKGSDLMHELEAVRLSVSQMFGPSSGSENPEQPGIHAAIAPAPMTSAPIDRSNVVPAPAAQQPAQSASDPSQGPGNLGVVMPPSDQAVRANGRRAKMTPAERKQANMARAQRKRERRAKEQQNAQHTSAGDVPENLKSENVTNTAASDNPGRVPAAAHCSVAAQFTPPAYRAGSSLPNNGNRNQD